MNGNSIGNFLWYGNSSESAGFKERFGGCAMTTEPYI